MDSSTLRKICCRDPKLKPCFIGVFPCDLLPKHVSWPCALIANTQPSNSEGEHWVAIFINKEGYGDFFCSYGQPPASVFVRFINNNCASWNYSKKCLQDFMSTTCGQHAVFFLHARSNGLSLSKFLSLFTTNRGENDEIVTAFINGKYNVNTVVTDMRLLR